MRTKSELVALIDEQTKGIGTLPLSPEWMYTAIRHCQRNEDFDLEENLGNGMHYTNGNEPDRYAGSAMAALLNALPEIRAALAE